MDNLVNPTIPDNCRHFFDPAKTREWVKENVKTAYTDKLNKIETGDFKLEVGDVHYDNSKDFSLEAQKEALMKRTDMTIPLKGTFKLINKTSGKCVAEKKTTIAQVPWITERNTSILNGTEYITIGQQRLKPGIYTRVRETGEAEGHVNVKPGTGLGGKLIFHPEKAVFVYVVGTTQIYLYGLLHDLGTSDESMREAWGNEIFLKNKATYKGDEVDKFYGKIFHQNY